MFMGTIVIVLNSSVRMRALNWIVTISKND